MADLISVTTAKIGKEDLDIQDSTSTTFSRATSTGGTQNITSLGLHTFADGVFNVKQYGATGDGSTDDTTAVLAAVTAAEAVNGVVVFPYGTYKMTDSIDITSGYVSLVGLGKPTILQTDLTKAIVIAGERSRIENLVLRFSTRPTASDTGAFGIQFGARSGGTSAHHSSIRNVEILQTFVGMIGGGLTEAPISESATITGGWFSCTFDNIVIRDFNYSAIWHKGATGAGAATGDVWNNIYINGREWDSSDKVVPTGPVIRLAQYSNAVFNQLNLEWIGDADTPTSFDSHLISTTAGNTENQSFVFNSVHVEGLYSTQTAGGMFRLAENVNLSFNGLEINSCTFAPGSSNFYNLFWFTDNDAHVMVNGLALRGNTVSSGTFRPSATGSSLTGCALEVRGFTPSDNDTSILTVNTAGNTVGDSIPLLRRWNDTIYYAQIREAAGLGLLSASKTIATGAITVAETESRVIIDTEGAASSDTLTTITGGYDGQLLVLEPANASREIVVQHGTGNINTADNRSFVMNGLAARLLLQYDSGMSKWVQVAASTGKAGYTRINLGGQTELTIASGVITPISSFHSVDTEGDASTDDLDTVTGASQFDAWVLTLKAANSARTVVLKDGTGNLALAGDCSLDNTEDTITLLWDNSQSKWLEIARSNNGA